METESIPFDTFQALTNCPSALKDGENRGCQRYATFGRRDAGRIYVDAGHSVFRFSVLRRVGANWQLTEGHETFERFEDAEAALIAAISKAGKAVTLVDVEPRARFGKGRLTRSAE